MAHYTNSYGPDKNKLNIMFPYDTYGTFFHRAGASPLPCPNNVSSLLSSMGPFLGRVNPIESDTNRADRD